MILFKGGGLVPGVSNFSGDLQFFGGVSNFSEGPPILWGVSNFFGGWGLPEYGQRSASKHPTGMHSCHHGVSHFRRSYLKRYETECLVKSNH